MFWLQDIKKQRERRKTKAAKGRQEKEEESWKHEKPHRFARFFLGHLECGLAQIYVEGGGVG